MNLTVAYLVGENKDLYIQVGETSEEALWNNVGPFNAATLVTVNGVGQNVWNADTKVDVDKVATATELGLIKVPQSGTVAFLLNSNGQISLNAANKSQIEAENPSSQTPITARNIQYAVKRGLVNPVGGIDAVGWTDEDKATACENIGASKKPTKTDLGVANAYGITEYLRNSAGEIESRIQYVSSSQTKTANRIPTYGVNGQLLVYTDSSSADDAAVNKLYAETNFNKKLYKHNLFVWKEGELPVMFSVISNIPRNQLETVGLNNEDGYVLGAGLRAFLVANEVNEEGIKCAARDVHGIPVMITGSLESTVMHISKLSIIDGELTMSANTVAINSNDQLQLSVRTVEL